ncbi:MAG: hypothetical protein JWO38_886 [Gemmataceae bacterium]|nr:hypothetical protein [Gemmataceae bacterium]
MAAIIRRRNPANDGIRSNRTRWAFSFRLSVAPNFLTGKPAPGRAARSAAQANSTLMWS